MENGRKKDEYIEKLDIIWSKVSKSRVSGFQNSVLRHILGEQQDGIDIKMVSYLHDNSLATPNKLYGYLVGGLRKLVTYAYIGVEKESKLRQEYDNRLSRMQAEMDNKDRLIEQYRSQRVNRPAPMVQVKKEIEYVEDTAEIDRLNNELERVKAQRDEWKGRYYELKANQSDIDLSKYVDMGLYTDAVADRDRLQGENDKLVSEKNKLSSNANSLKSQLSDCKTELREYRQNEKKVLPILRKSVFQQQHQGKCITLEPSQIETIIRRYLDGDKPHKISKGMGVSKTSINMIIRCEYRTEQSISKILRALHAVNKEGHWGEEKQEQLNGLIQDYENSLSVVKDMKSIQNRNIRENIQSLSDYLEWVENKKHGLDDEYIEDI